MQESKYTIAPVTFEDSDRQLFYTDIFYATGRQAHAFTAWGPTKEASRNMAEALLSLIDTAKSLSKPIKA